MPIQPINTGTSANAGNGDSIRLAFHKVNQNFDFVQGLISGTSTNFNSSVRSIVEPMFVHNEHVGIIAGYDNIDDQIILTVTGNVPSLNVGGLATMNDVLITGTMNIGLVQFNDDVNIIKSASDGSLNLRLKNTFSTGTVEINLLDHTTGSFNIVHQNLNTSTGFFRSGENYIFDSAGRNINIGRTSNINFFSTQTFAGYVNPAVSITNTGTVNVRSTLSLAQNHLLINDNILKIENSVLSINGLSIQSEIDKLVSGDFTLELTTTGNVILPGNNILEYIPGRIQGSTVTNLGSAYSSLGPFSGVGSIYFDGTSTVEVSGGSHFNLTSGTYTVEWFQRLLSFNTATVGTVFLLGTLDNQVLQGLNSYSNLLNSTATGAVLSGAFQVNAPAANPFVNTWTHIAIVKTTSTFKVFVNGVGTASTSTLPAPLTTTSNLVIGAAKIAGGYLNEFTGFLSNMRWEAREVYTNNFAPPTSKLTATSNTRLLLAVESEENFLLDTSGLNPKIPDDLALILGTSSYIFSDTGELIINQNGAYDDVKIPGTLIRVDTDQSRYTEISIQNHSSGTTATSDIVIARDDGDVEQGIGILDIGINSSNYQELEPFGIHTTGSAYIFTNDADLIIGTQDPGKRLIFHAGGSTANDSAVILDDYVWQFNRSVQTIVATPSPLNFTVRNTSNDPAAEAVFQAMNNPGEYLQMGIKSANINAYDGSMGPKSGFLHIHGTTSTLHIGKTGDIAFWSDAVNNGFSGAVTPTLYMSRVDQSSKFGGHVLPATDLTHDLGSASKQWRSLYVGTGTIYIGGVPISVNTVTGTLLVGSTISSTATNLATEGFVANYVAENVTRISSTSTLNNDPYVVSLDASGVLTVPGNVLPDTDNSFTLGSISSQWQSLHIGTGSVYINNKSLDISAEGRLIVDSQEYAIASLNSGSYAITLVSDGSLFKDSQFTINITTGNNFVVNSGDDIVLQGANGNAALLEGGDINIYGGDGGSADAFNPGGTGGDLTLRAGTGGTGAAGTDGGHGGYVEITAGTGGAADVINIIPAKSGGDLILSAGSAGANGSDTTLGAAGGSTYINAGHSNKNNINGGGVIIQSGAAAGTGSISGDVRIAIPSSDNNSSSTWIFSPSSTVTFPDSTVQSTAYTGIASSGTTATTAAHVGYIGMPQNLQTAGYTLAAEDQGKHIYCTGTSFTVTIPANTVTSFPIGSTVAFISAPGSTTTISIDNDTLYLVGSGLTGNRTLAPYGMATAIKVDEITWFISGTGLT